LPLLKFQPSYVAGPWYDFFKAISLGGKFVNVSTAPGISSYKYSESQLSNAYRAQEWLDEPINVNWP